RNLGFDSGVFIQQWNEARKHSSHRALIIEIVPRNLNLSGQSLHEPARKIEPESILHDRACYSRNLERVEGVHVPAHLAKALDALPEGIEQLHGSTQHTWTGRERAQGQQNFMKADE